VADHSKFRSGSKADIKGKATIRQLWAISGRLGADDKMRPIREAQTSWSRLENPCQATSIGGITPVSCLPSGEYPPGSKAIQYSSSEITSKNRELKNFFGGGPLGKRLAFSPPAAIMPTDGQLHWYDSR
jgi:hypothetical protein